MHGVDARDYNVLKIGIILHKTFEFVWKLKK